MSGLIWIQTVRHPDGMTERIFQKVDFEKNQLTTKKHGGKGLNALQLEADTDQTVPKGTV